MRELSLNVMDIAQNSISAGASLITIAVEEDLTQDLLRISVKDNGRGMTPEQVQNVTDPFYTTRTTRNVGLGVPLFKMEAEMTGGHFTIDSTVGVGTELAAVFHPSSVDMIPLGDINGTMLLLVTGNPDRDFLFTRSYKDHSAQRDFALNTAELREVLGGDVSLNAPEVVLSIKDYLEEQTHYVLTGQEPAEE